MSNPFFDHPILNSPYEIARRQWGRAIPGRHIAVTVLEPSNVVRSETSAEQMGLPLSESGGQRLRKRRVRLRENCAPQRMVR